MFCPLLSIKSDNPKISFGQCMEGACAWWVVNNGTGKCAICKMGDYAAKQESL
ncbi:MAG: hypothetical protein ABFC84_04330 [Veillonellales bacterium]